MLFELIGFLNALTFVLGMTMTVLILILPIVAWEDTWSLIKRLRTLRFNTKKFKLSMFKTYSKL